MGRRPGSFVDTRYVLRQFSNDDARARKAYRRFVGEGIALGRNSHLTGGGLVRSSGGWSQVVSARRRKEPLKGDERILGDSDFVLTVISEAEKRQKRQFHNANPEMRIGEIMREECRRRQVSATELESGIKRQNVTAAREAIALRCARDLGLTAAEIARRLGVGTSAITKAIQRAEKKSRQGDGE